MTSFLPEDFAILFLHLDWMSRSFKSNGQIYLTHCNEVVVQTYKNFRNHKVKFVFTDIDGTLTTKGQLTDKAYLAVWNLTRAGIAVVPITGRPAGWCELIARQWPVHGVIGENGAFYFLHSQKMRRIFLTSKSVRRANRERFRKILERVKMEVPRARLASDQFCRLFDLAIDFAEDVGPLSSEEIKKIVKCFTEAGAQAKVSDIHVNGWFGDYNKRSACELFVKNELGLSPQGMQERCAFIGDSPNDEPMFEFFENSFAVANIREFVSQIKFLPKFVANATEGSGFAEIANHLIELRAEP